MKWKKLRLNILHAPEEGEGCITPQALTRNLENGKSLHPDREGLALIVTMFNGNKPYMQKNRSPGSWEVRVMQGRTGWQLWDTPHRLWTLYGQPFTSIMSNKKIGQEGPLSSVVQKTSLESSHEECKTTQMMRSRCGTWAWFCPDAQPCPLCTTCYSVSHLLWSRGVKEISRSERRFHFGLDGWDLDRWILCV